MVSSCQLVNASRVGSNPAGARLYRLWLTCSWLTWNVAVYPGGGSRRIFDVMLGSGTDMWPNVQTFLPEKCTHFTEMYRKFRPKMHPSLWNVQKIWPKIVPICITYVVTNFIQRYTSFLKIYRMLSGKMLPTMIKCTGNRTVKLYSFL